MATTKKQTHEGVLEKTAKVIGSALGTAAVKTGIAHGAASGPRIVDGKYQKSHKHRMPRKAKKVNKKQATASAGARK